MDIPPEVIAAKNAAEFAILAIPGVVGVGIGFREENGQLFDEVAIRIHLADGVDTPPGLPEELGGVAISIIPGSITPCITQDETRYADLGGGIKITQPSRGYGTMGAIVKDAADDTLLGLTNFHVAGPVSNVFPDTIWQATNPPLIAETRPAADDNIGHVVRVDFPQTPPLPLSPLLVGLVDAAVFTLDEAQAHNRTLSPRIVSDTGLLPNLVDRVTDTGVFTVGLQVRKRGFRTRLTTGFIVGGFTTFQWTAGPSNSFLMDQAEIMGASTNPGMIFCDEGDSGSLVLEDGTATAIGLLWGNKQGGQRGIMCGAREVESQLGVRFVW